jgi:hypothetical protein
VRPASEPPAIAAWRHRGAREGFEVAVLQADAGGGARLDGQVAAVEEGEAWAVRYEVAVDERWRTREARVASLAEDGAAEVVLEADGAGRWRVDGRPAPHLDGCLDVDLEASVSTNALPVHRLALTVGAGAEAPAAYVRAPGLAVERLEQRYDRMPDDAGRLRFAYAAPRFAYRGELAYDPAGLVLDYPGLAERVR